MVNDPRDWPAVDYESIAWHRPDGMIGSRRALLQARGPYLAAIPPLIGGRRVELEPEVLAAADEASEALARFDAEAGSLVAPFASILLRTESASSSEVENLTASAKQVSLAEINASRSDNARLVVANVRAMDAALLLSAHLDEDSVIAMHAELLGDSAPHFVGSWRDQPVWIGGGISPHSAQFVPPAHSRIPQLMDDLIGFAERTDIPVLAQAAIAHAQFETIHPFPDGNGRTGRAILHAMLHRGGLTRNVVVPVSAGLLHDTASYFAALTAYREGDVDAIVRAVTNAAFSAVSNGRALARDIRSIRSRWEAALTARSDSSAYAALDVLLAQPTVTAAILAERLSVSDVAAGNAVARLVEAGVLTKASGNARYRIWQATDVLDALDAFAERARRGR